MDPNRLTFSPNYSVEMSEKFARGSQKTSQQNSKKKLQAQILKKCKSMNASKNKKDQIQKSFFDDNKFQLCSMSNLNRVIQGSIEGSIGMSCIRNSTGNVCL